MTAGNLSNLPKKATVKFTVLTNNHGVGTSNRQKETSYGSQIGLRLGDHSIEDNPKSAIAETWQSIRSISSGALWSPLDRSGYLSVLTDLI